jgi:integrase
MARQFRVGNVAVYLRGKVWYLRYHEQGRRRQVRGGTDKVGVKQLAAEVNAQLVTGAPAATSFERISLVDLRRRWLDHHEHVLRSAVSTVNRYRAASQHLLNFADFAKLSKRACQFKETQAEAFVRYLRKLSVSPNGHPNTAHRALRDKGIKFILEVCRTLFNFALKRRHLPPYGDNPFTLIQVDRIPIEDAKPIQLMTADQEVGFLKACDPWQLPVFATLLLTGMRPGELVHLLVEDIDLDAGVAHVRNKPELGWRVKTRQQRSIPLLDELRQLLELTIGNRCHGPVFQRRRFANSAPPPMSALAVEQLKLEAAQRVDGAADRRTRDASLRQLWTSMGRARPPGRRARRIWANAAVGSSKNITPKRENRMSNAPSGGSALLASATLNRTGASWGASARARPISGSDMSTPSTWPPAPTRAARARLDAPAPQPTSSTRSPVAGAAASIAAWPNTATMASSPAWLASQRSPL